MLINPDIRPVRSPDAVFRVDGVLHEPGEAAVLAPHRRDAFVGILPWSLELAASTVRRLPPVVRLASGPLVRRADADAWLGALRPLLLRARGYPRFVLCTVTRLDVSPTRVRLFGTCAPLLPDAVEAGYRADRTRR